MAALGMQQRQSLALQQVLSPQLNQQTLAQIARANSRRIKCLD